MVIRRVVLSTRFAVFAAMLLLAMQWRPPLAFLLCAAAAAVVIVRHSIASAPVAAMASGIIGRYWADLLRGGHVSSKESLYVTPLLYVIWCV
jgi:hypothetical protein